MSLDTYLPEGGGRYIVGRIQGDAASFYCFMPESPDHVRVGLKVTGRGEYIGSEYTDVIVYSPDAEFQPLESGEYQIVKKSRSRHCVEFKSEGSKKRFSVYAQPRLGRFRLLSDG